MDRKSAFFAVAISAVLSGRVYAEPDSLCPVESTKIVTDGKEQRKVHHTKEFIYYRSGLRVNTDGAPNSYHPLGRREGGALNSICNGIAVRPTGGAYQGQRVSALSPSGMTMQQRCQTILDVFRAAAASDYSDFSAGTIDWYAIAIEQNNQSGRKGRPCIQKDGPHKGYFVAQTAFQANPRLDTCDVDRWLNSSVIPYITLPRGSQVFQSSGVRLGDIALVHRLVDSKDVWIVAVVGDTGNRDELGEGSIALHHALGHLTPQGRAHPGNIDGGVTTFLFPGRRAPLPLSADVLSNSSLMKDLFDRAGGEDKLVACARKP